MVNLFLLREALKMKYYLEVESDIHHPTAKEIAEIIGIYNVSNQPHAMFVRAYLGRSTLQYLGRNGMVQVFNNYSAMLALANDMYEYCKREGINEIYYSLDDGRGYNLKLFKGRIRTAINRLKNMCKGMIENETK